MPLSNSTVYLRVGALAELAGMVVLHTARRVFFVIDAAAYRACGAEAEVEAALATCAVARFTQFDLNPKIEDVARGIELFREFQPDLVIALGGGTAIDLGKLIGALAHQPDPIREIITGQATLTKAATPLIAIPTTAGTGSEATHFAVVYMAGEKYSLAHPSLLPCGVIIDPRVTYSLPASITAATGLDAFCQAVESLWAVGASEASIADASRALRLAWQHLGAAVNHPTPESRLGMCEASHLAGRAINISKTTAPHALSYRITSQFRIPHGKAVALTLSPLLEYNAQVTAADCQDPRSVEHVRQRIATIVELLGARTVSEACRNIEAFIAQLGCPASLADAGIVDIADLRQIVESANFQRMSNNPRRLNADALLALLQTPRAACPPIVVPSPSLQTRET